MYWYKRYMSDYADDTQGLTMAEHGAYTLMLDSYYSTGLPLPSDRREVYRIVRAIERWERSAVDRVLAKFFTLTSAGYINPRADEELAKYKKAAEVSRANGSRHTTGQEPDSLPDRLPERPQNLRSKESKNNTKPKSLGAKAAPKRATPFQKDFSLTEGLHQYASDRGVVDVVAEFEKFREHHLARGTLFKDWGAAWRTWVLRSAQYAKQRPDSPKESAYRREVSVGLGPEVHRPLPQVHAPVQPDLLRAVSTVAAKKGF